MPNRVSAAKRRMCLLIGLLVPFGSAAAEAAPGSPRVLFFSKAASWEQKIVHRDAEQLSYLERQVEKLGKEQGIDFTFSKDGTLFTAENLARFDAFLFFTSGDLTSQARNGRGDNFPLMTLEGKKAFLDAIQSGKGFIGCNTANYTFPNALSPGEKNSPETAWRYTRMIGAGYMGHNEVQKGHFTWFDRKFPGMEDVPADYGPVDQWYAFNRLMPDMHVILALDAPKLKGNLYERPAYPIAWARMQGKGRVFYTTMGHTTEIWQDRVFLKMLLGGIRWATGRVDADIRANLNEVTPQASEIPQRAAKYIAAMPPLPNPHFPNFNVHFPQFKVPHSPEAFLGQPRRVLFFSKSAGIEHPIAYREGANCCFLENEMLQFGAEYNIDFVFSKDGTFITPENLMKFDAIVFYTSGDLVEQSRAPLGDNYPLMTAAGKAALLKAVREGKGFVGIHSAVDTFSHPGDSAHSTDLDPYAKMLGAGCKGRGGIQKRTVFVVDKGFPGGENVPDQFQATQEWFWLTHRQGDLHVILARDRESAGDSKGLEPLAWARMEGKGRVYYTGLGHDEEMWKSPVFRQMLLGALRWTTGAVDADLGPAVHRHADRKATQHSAPAQPKRSATALAEYPVPAPVAPKGSINIDVGRQLHGICHAMSRDGLYWERPSLDVARGENRVLPYHEGWELSGFSVALDSFTQNPAERFKMLAYHRYKNRYPGDKGDDNPPAKMYGSADGVHWGEPQMVKWFTGDNASIIDIQLGFSRDGVTYPRPSREAFIASARKPGAWNRGYLHSANGVCLIGGVERPETHPPKYRSCASENADEHVDTQPNPRALLTIQS